MNIIKKFAPLVLILVTVASGIGYYLLSQLFEKDSASHIVCLVFFGLQVVLLIFTLFEYPITKDQIKDGDWTPFLFDLGMAIQPIAALVVKWGIILYRYTASKERKIA